MSGSRRRHKKNVEEGKITNGVYDGESPVFMSRLKGATQSRVDLSGNNLGDSGVQAIANFYTINHFQNNFCCVKVLSLQWNNIWADGARALATLLANEDSTIQKLNLGHNNIGSTGLYHVAKALRSNKTLCVLELNDNGIDDEGAQYLLSSFDDNSTLLQVGLSCNPCSHHLVSRISEQTRANEESQSMERIIQESDLKEKYQSLGVQFESMQSQNEALKTRISVLETKNKRLTSDVAKYQKLSKIDMGQMERFEAASKEAESKRALEAEVANLTLRLKGFVSAAERHENEKSAWVCELSSVLKAKKVLEDQVQRFDRAGWQSTDIDGLSAVEEELESFLKEVRSIKVRKLQKRYDELAESRKCKVCFDKYMDTLLFPCGHLLLCQICSAKVDKCPLCHIAIERRMKVFEA